MQPMSDTLSFQGGTLVISQRPQSDPPGAPFQWIKGRWRCEGYHYPSLPHLDLRDTVVLPAQAVDNWHLTASAA
jgi:hypothetical protein